MLNNFVYVQKRRQLFFPAPQAAMTLWPKLRAQSCFVSHILQKPGVLKPNTLPIKHKEASGSLFK